MTLAFTPAVAAVTGDPEHSLSRTKSAWQKMAQQQQDGEPDTVSADPNFTTATYGDWVLRCDRTSKTAAKVCDIAQTAQGQDQQGAIAQLSIAKDAGGWRIYGLLPTNIKLPSTVVLKAPEDSANLELNWQRCLPTGCLSETAPSKANIDRWRKKSGQAQLVYKDATGADVVAPISLRGFSQALDALERESP